MFAFLTSFPSASNSGPDPIRCRSWNLHILPPQTPQLPLPVWISSCRDGVPYCESDYHSQFGIKCETCDRYISGRVLEVSGYKSLQRCFSRGACDSKKSSLRMEKVTTPPFFHSLHLPHFFCPSLACYLTLSRQPCLSGHPQNEQLDKIIPGSKML